MPAGSDTVVIQELTTRDGDIVTIQKPTAKGATSALQGIDFAQGDVLLRKGRRLTDRDLMLAAAMNHPNAQRAPAAESGRARHRRRTGAAWQHARAGEIVYSNGFALIALARSEGADVHDLGIARDRIEDIAAAIRRAREWGADILVTSGGASVGDHDLVQRALAAEGLDLSFWRVALRPGRPMMHGRLGGMQVLGVPGNPVSSYVCAFLFLVPLIRRLAGRSDVEQRARTGPPWARPAGQ